MSGQAVLIGMCFVEFLRFACPSDTCQRRKHEEYINSFPNFTAPIKDSDGKEHKIHFVGLFSSSPEITTPILFMHGWPGKLS